MPRLPALLYFAAASALLGSLLFGYHLGVLNTCQTHVEADLHGSGGILVTGFLMGATAGSLLSGRLADRCGPRTASALNTSVLLAGAALSTFTGGFWVMLAGRVAAGLGSGAASVLCPRYLAELSPVAIRGSLGTLTQVTVNVGILCSYLVGLPYEQGTDTITLFGHQVQWWRVMFGAAIVPALVQFVALARCPESPLWLMNAGQTARAEKALRRLHGHAFRPQDYPKLQQAGAAAAAAAEGTQPLLSAAEQGGSSHEGGCTSSGQHGQHRSLGWSALLQPRYRRVMVLASAIPLLQQLSGINSIVFFSTKVFEQAGLQSPIVGSIAVGATNLGFTLVAAALMERAGRRFLLIMSFSGMAACLATLAAFMLLPTPKSLEGAASLACIMGFMVCFALGAGPIPFLVLPEILPQEIMGTAQAFCTSLNWSSNILIGACFPVMLSTLGIAGSYLVFAALCASSALFFHRHMVETKGQTVEAIHVLLVGS
ncbi:Plastidic glucose transporter 4 [Chlorella vulgaris]